MLKFYAYNYDIRQIIYVDTKDNPLMVVNGGFCLTQDQNNPDRLAFPEFHINAKKFPSGYYWIADLTQKEANFITDALDAEGIYDNHYNYLIDHIRDQINILQNEWWFG